jgi:Ca-activated chloride channel homolog
MRRARSTSRRSRRRHLSQVYSTLATKLVPEKKLTEIAFVFAGIGALLALLSAALSMLWLGRIA